MKNYINSQKDKEIPNLIESEVGNIILNNMNYPVKLKYSVTDEKFCLQVDNKNFICDRFDIRAYPIENNSIMIHMGHDKFCIHPASESWRHLLMLAYCQLWF